MQWRNSLLEDNVGYRNVVRTQIRRIIEESISTPASQVVVAHHYLPTDILELLTNLKGKNNSPSKIHNQLMEQKHIKEWFDRKLPPETFYTLFYKTMWGHPQFVVYRLNLTSKALEQLTDLVYGYLLFQLKGERLLDATTNAESEWALRLFTHEQVDAMFKVFNYLEPETEVLNDIKITFNENMMVELDKEINRALIEFDE